MPDETLSKQDYETLSNFRYQLRRFLRFSEEVVHEHGLTHLQYLLLLHVRGYHEREWATIGELAEKLQCYHHGAVSLVSRCEKLGLVYRQQGRHDKREVEVHLTTEGNRMVERLARLHRDELIDSSGVFRVPGVHELKKGT